MLDSKRKNNSIEFKFLVIFMAIVMSLTSIAYRFIPISSNTLPFDIPYGINSLGQFLGIGNKPGDIKVSPLALTVVENSARGSVLIGKKKKLTPIHSASEVREDNSIVTEELSSITLNFEDKRFYFIGENSKVNLDILCNPVGRSDVIAFLSLDYGNVITDVREPLTGYARNEILACGIDNTPVIAASVGTSYAVMKDEQGGVKLFVFSGVVYAAGGRNEVLTIVPGEMGDFTSNTPAVKKLSKAEIEGLPGVALNFIDEHCTETPETFALTDYRNNDEIKEKVAKAESYTFMVQDPLFEAIIKEKESLDNVSDIMNLPSLPNENESKSDAIPPEQPIRPDKDEDVKKNEEDSKNASEDESKKDVNASEDSEKAGTAVNPLSNEAGETEKNKKSQNDKEILNTVDDTRKAAEEEARRKAEEEARIKAEEEAAALQASIKAEKEKLESLEAEVTNQHSIVVEAGNKLIAFHTIVVNQEKIVSVEEQKRDKLAADLNEATTRAIKSSEEDAQKLKALEMAMQQQDQKVSEEKSKLESLQTSYESLRVGLENERKIHSDMKEEYFAAERNVEDMAAKLAEMEDNYRQQYESVLSQLSAEIEDLVEKIKKTDEILSSREKSATEIKNMIEVQKQDISVKEDEKTSREQTIRSLEVQLTLEQEKLKQIKEQTSENSRHFQDQLIIVNTKIKELYELKKDYELFDEALSEMYYNQGELSKQLEAVEKELEGALSEKEANEESLKDLREAAETANTPMQQEMLSQIDEYQQALKDAQTAKSETQESLKSQTEKVDSSESQLQEKGNEIISQQEVLTAEQKSFDKMQQEYTEYVESSEERRAAEKTEIDEIGSRLEVQTETYEKQKSKLDEMHEEENIMKADLDEQEQHLSDLQQSASNQKSVVNSLTENQNEIQSTSSKSEPIENNSRSNELSAQEEHIDAGEESASQSVD